MKKLLFILMLSILLLESLSLANSIESEPRTLFKLQSDNRNMLSIFSNTVPVNLTVEIHVTDLDANLVLYYSEPRGDQTYISKTIELMNDQQYNYTLNTNEIKLFLQTQNSNYENYTATGFYRIVLTPDQENLTWTPFKLFLSTPNSIDLFRAESSWINNVSVDFQVIELTGGKFIVEEASSDVINMHSISELGSYTYHFNTSFVTFSLQSTNYSRAVGYYTLTDHGKMYQYNMIGFSFETVAMILLSTAIVIKYKRKK